MISYLPSIIPWSQIVHLTIKEPLQMGQLHFILSYTSHLHTLELDEVINDITDLHENERLSTMDLLNNITTCEMLMTNGLRELIFRITSDTPNIIDIAHMIVERLPRLQIIQVHCHHPLLLKFMCILINGLNNLIFLIVECARPDNKLYELELLALRTANMRPFRTDTQVFEIEGFLRVWL